MVTQAFGWDGSGLVIVAEQVAEFGGSERVLEALLARFPEASLLAPRFTTEAEPRPAGDDRLRRASLFGPAGRRRHHLLPLYARRVAAADLGAASVVLSLVHSGWSLAATLPPGARHVAYSAGLPRAFYGHEGRYVLDYAAPVRPLLRAAVPALRGHYRALMRRPHCLITNSEASARALRDVTQRSPEVVYPPVRTSFFTPARRPRKSVLAVGRLVAGKRMDVLVDAFRGHDEDLVVAGTGPWLERLRASAPRNVRFTGFVADDDLRELYRTSRVVVCPAVEEFGIVAAEAQATGTPVVAPARGGAVEIVRDGVTGLLLQEVTPKSITAALARLQDDPPSESACRTSAERFTEERFTVEIESLLAQALDQARPGALAVASRQAARAAARPGRRDRS